MTDRMVLPISSYELAAAYTALRGAKKPSPRVKASIARLEDALCRFAEGIRSASYGPLDPNAVDEAVKIVKDKLSK